jgi:hypothetical protein
VDDVLVFKGSLHKSPEYETVASDLDKYNSQIKHSRGTQSRWNPSSVDALGAIAEGGLRWVTPYGLDPFAVDHFLQQPGHPRKRGE